MDRDTREAFESIAIICGKIADILDMLNGNVTGVGFLIFLDIVIHLI